MPPPSNDYDPFAEADASSEAEDSQSKAPVGGNHYDPFEEAGLAPSKIGGGESFGRGLAEMSTLGFQPQISATLGKLSGQDYEKNLALERAKNKAAAQQHPYLHGAGMATGVLPAVLGAIYAGPEELAGAGAATAGRILGGVANPANLAGLGLRAGAGAGEGLAPSLARGAAGVLENPLTQGAIFGLSEGEKDDTGWDTAKRAALGAGSAYLGGKLFDVAGAAGKGIGKKLIEPVAKAFSPDFTSAQLAAAAADRLGVSLPFAATKNGLIQNFSNKFDLFKQIPQAAAQTLQELGGKISEIAPEIHPEDAGDALLGSIKGWLKGGAQKEVNEVYEPVKILNNDVGKFRMSGLREAIDKLRNSDDAAVVNLEPNFEVAERALSNPDGLSLKQMRKLRDLINNHINFGTLPNAQTMDQGALQEMRLAVTQDMLDAARHIGGESAAEALHAADQAASKIYGKARYLNKKLNPNSNTGSKTFRILQQATTKNQADSDLVNAVKSVVSPEAWQQFTHGHGQSFVSDPRTGTFTFGNFGKQWANLTDEAKDALYGPSNQGSARAVLDDIVQMGSKGIGNKLDQYGGQFGALPSNMNLGPIGLGAMLEQGVPIKTMIGSGLASGAAKSSARNVASKLPNAPIKTAMRNNAAINAATAIAKRAAPGVKAIGNVAGESARRAAQMTGAGVGASLAPNAIPLGLLAGAKALDFARGNFRKEDFEPEESAGGRVGRATGGGVHNAPKHEYLVNRLLKMAKDAKKVSDRTTEPLLKMPDEHIVRALDVAQQAI